MITITLNAYTHTHVTSVSCGDIVEALSCFKGQDQSYLITLHISLSM